LRVLAGELLQGLVDPEYFIDRLGVSQPGVVELNPPLPPPRFRRPLRRAFSTRMRRMASAAAAKKCPRLSQHRDLLRIDEPQIGLVD